MTIAVPTASSAPPRPIRLQHPLHLPVVTLLGEPSRQASDNQYTGRLLPEGTDVAEHGVGRFRCVCVRKVDMREGVPEDGIVRVGSSIWRCGVD
jgi:hypothetical protein